MAKIRKVKYVAGAGCLLQNTLSDGQFSFKKGIAYEIPVYSDFLRLVSTGDFVEVVDEVEVEKEPELVDVKIDEIQLEDKEPKKAKKDKGLNLSLEGDINN